MSWQNNLPLIKLFSFILGAVIVLWGFEKYAADKSQTALLIALAVIIVGPLEDLLNKLGNSESWYELVNQLTSMAFLVLLGIILQEESSK